MQYRTMPKSGDELSALGFGCMRLPMKNGRVDEERAISQIRSAIDRGVNYVDTAWPYHGGESEIVLGKALKDGYREKVKLATKLPSWLLESRANMDKYLNAQLDKLGTDKIDYYLVHTLNGTLWKTVKDLGVREFLDQAKKDGRIVNAGFSFHGQGADFAPIVDSYDWDFCMIQYNFLDQEFQAGTAGLKYVASKGLGLIVMEPLRGGYLAATPPAEIQQIWDEADTKRSHVDWSLRWIWSHPEVKVIISGMNEETHIDENIASACGSFPDSLSEKELNIIDRVGKKYKELMKVGCTGCGYCMPCPVGVDIPGAFNCYNLAFLTGMEGASFHYILGLSGIMAEGQKGYASMCVSCGECIDKCPQFIPIPDVLKEVAAEFEGEGFEERSAGVIKMFVDSLKR